MFSRPVLWLSACFLLLGIAIIFYCLYTRPDTHFYCRTHFTLAQQLDTNRIIAEGSTNISLNGNQLLIALDGLAKQNDSHYMILRDIILQLVPAPESPGKYRIIRRQVKRYPEDNLSAAIADSIPPIGSGTEGYVTITHPDAAITIISNNDGPLYGCRNNK